MDIFNPLIRLVSVNRNKCLPHGSAPQRPPGLSFKNRNFFGILEGEVGVETKLLHQPFAHIFFPGSTNGEKSGKRAGAKRVRSVTMGRGGKSRRISDSDYDLKKATKKKDVGKFVKAGKTCIAPDYEIIEKDVQDKFAGLNSATDHVWYVLYQAFK
ncbi:aldehyde dehydrogenase family protein [Bacillus mojavensis]|nr:aldehyde dehydrogenase family protein [Bacillus mojavensis]